jgi:hypothetical protein
VWREWRGGGNKGGRQEVVLDGINPGIIIDETCRVVEMNQ